MNKIFGAVLGTALFSLIILAMPVQADTNYDINSYDITIDVGTDNTYEIVETINTHFYNPRHGIYRTIPLKYNDRYFQIEDVEVYDPVTGRTYTTEITRESGELTIRIGDADIYVSGDVSYAISYTYIGGLDYNDEMDEFYFNLIGNDWNAVIDQVNFVIQMPKAFDADRLNITSGRYGSTDTSNITYTISGNNILGSTKRPLNAYESLTVALPLEEGYYSEATATVNALPVYITLAAMAGLFAFVYFKNREYWRDNIVTPITGFRPPEDLNAPEVAYVYNREYLNTKDVAPILLNWAAKGYIKIGDHDGEDMYFVRLSALASDSKPYEKMLFNKMFALGKDGRVYTSQLKNHFYEHLQMAVGAVRYEFQEEKEILVNSVQTLTKVFAGLAGLIFAVGFAVIADAFLRTGIEYNLLGGFAAGLLILLIFSLVFMVKQGRTMINNVIGKYLVYLIVAGFGYGSTVIISSIRYFTELNDIILMYSRTAFIAYVLYFILYAASLWAILTIREYTLYGLDKVNHIEGFRHFLKTAKVDQMEAVYKEDPDYFYDILPYAMALDLTGIWEKIAEQIALEPPEWYDSNRPFRTHVFINNMNHTVAAATSQPAPSGGSSGGSSGGGFSGGGGGGGGGGSW